MNNLTLPPGSIIKRATELYPETSPGDITIGYNHLRQQGFDDATIERDLPQLVQQTQAQLAEQPAEQPDAEMEDAYKQFEQQKEGSKTARLIGAVAAGLGSSVNPDLMRQNTAMWAERDKEMRESTIGKYEKKREQKAKDLDQKAKQQQIETQKLSAEMEGAKYDAWKIDRERTLKEQQDSDNPASDVSKMVQAQISTMIQQYPTVKTLFESRGMDPSTMSATQLTKLIPGMDKIVDNTKQQMKLQYDKEIAEARNAAKLQEIASREAQAAARIAQQSAAAESRLVGQREKALSTKEVAQEKEFTKRAEKVGAIDSSIAGMEDTLADLDNAEKLSKTIMSGQYAGPVAGVWKSAEREEFDRLANLGQLQAAVRFLKGQGAVSNAERLIAKGTVFSADKSPKANKDAINDLRKAVQADLTLAKQLRNKLEAGRGGESAAPAGKTVVETRRVGNKTIVKYSDGSFGEQ